jgi:hypothetical protein
VIATNKCNRGDRATALRTSSRCEIFYRLCRAIGRVSFPKNVQSQPLPHFRPTLSTIIKPQHPASLTYTNNLDYRNDLSLRNLVAAARLKQSGVPSAFKVEISGRIAEPLPCCHGSSNSCAAACSIARPGATMPTADLSSGTCSLRTRKERPSSLCNPSPSLRIYFWPRYLS